MARRLDVDAVSADHERHRVAGIDRRTKPHQRGERGKKQLHLMSPDHDRETSSEAARPDVM